MGTRLELGHFSKCRYEYGCKLIDERYEDERTRERIKNILYTSFLRIRDCSPMIAFTTALSEDKVNRDKYDKNLANDIFSIPIETVVKIIGK